MAYTKKTYRFPESNEIFFSYKGRYGARGEKREKKKKATPEQMNRQNQWNREKRMRWLMKANFFPGDLWCTLKYPRGTRKPVGEVLRDLRNFFGRLRRRYRKYGEELKFIYRMEIGSRGGIHIHLLVNRIRGKPGEGQQEELPDTALIIQEAWKPCGRIHYEPVYSEGLFQNLAAYMTKQPDEEVEKQLSLFPEEDRKKLIKTESSRNLIRPEPEVKEYGHWTMRKILEEGPEPTPGYYIDPDSIVSGVNPVTGMSYLQYIEYSLYAGTDSRENNGADDRGETGRGRRVQNRQKRDKSPTRRAISKITNRKEQKTDKKSKKCDKDRMREAVDGEKDRKEQKNVKSRRKRDKSKMREASEGAEMDKKSVNIYIATSIAGPRRGRGVYMYLLECFKANGEAVTRQQAAEMEDATENQLAVCALEAALGRLTAECYLTIHTDCAYLASILDNREYDRWREHDWQTVRGGAVKYVDKWRRISDLLHAQDFRVKLKEHHAYKGWMKDEIRKKM